MLLEFVWFEMEILAEDRTLLKAELLSVVTGADGKVSFKFVWFELRLITVE